MSTNTITECKPWCTEHYAPEDHYPDKEVAEYSLDGDECVSSSLTVDDVAIWLVQGRHDAEPLVGISTGSSDQLTLAEAGQLADAIKELRSAVVEGRPVLNGRQASPKRNTEFTAWAEATSREISRTISEKLETAGISRDTASTETGIPYSTLNHRLAGESPLTVDELVALADLLGIPPSELVANAEADERDSK
jgi:lambda repressor-like predicted transcriptional regulator